MTQAAGTIIARNYVATARVLQDSFATAHPEIPFYTLLIDGTDVDRDLPGLGIVLLPSDLPMSTGEWFGMAARYTVMELATAAKPTLLRHLLAGHQVAMYLDPDIRVYQPLTPEFAAAAEHAIALTPHCLRPVPRDGLDLTERALMLAGLFNLGFIAVSRDARPFLRWWSERLRFDAVVDVQNALFTDQRWIDWVPTLFAHTVLRDPGLNVAYWNAHERDLHRGWSGQVFAGTAPLRFFHFSGYDLTKPWLLSKHAGPRPRTQLADHPVIEDLCAEYAAELESAGFAEFAGVDYSLDVLPSGLRLTPEIRWLIRTEQMAGVPVPNPYQDPVGFHTWLMEPVAGTNVVTFRRWQTALWRVRPDLQAAFPDLAGPDAARFHHWLTHDPAAVALRPAQSAQPAPASVAAALPASFHRHGWSVIAYTDAELGVGEAGRRLVRAVAQLGLPTEVVGVSTALSRESHVHRHELTPAPRLANTITCVNGDQLDRVWHSVGLDSHTPGGRIGLWFWEVDEVPQSWLPQLNRLDQLWVASEYTRAVFDRLGRCPVELIRLPVLPRAAATSRTRAGLGLPEDRFMFLCSFDFLSVLRRKNPLDVITAYLAAFGPNDGASLVLKSINGHHRQVELAMIRRATARRPDIHVVDGYRSAGEMSAMIELADCVVSLHRAEGYGLNLVDAMSHATPVIATGFSGNLTFMDEASAYLVPYELVEVGPGSEPYPTTATWAQPDPGAASGIMRQVFDDQATARDRGRAGQQKILRENSLQVAGARLAELTAAVGRGPW